MANREAFAAELRGILAPSSNPRLTKIAFNIRSYLWEWLEAAKEQLPESEDPSEKTLNRLLNNAITLAGFRGLATKYGLHCLGRDEDDNTILNLPLTPPAFVPASDDIKVSCNLIDASRRFLGVMTEQGVDPNTTMEDGIRLMGTLATKPSAYLCAEFVNERNNSVSVGDIDPLKDLANAPFLADFLPE